MTMKIITVMASVHTATGEDIAIEVRERQCRIWTNTECGELYHYGTPPPYLGNRTLADLPHFDAIFKHFTQEYAASQKNPLGQFLHHIVTALERAHAQREGASVYFVQAGERIKIGWSKKVATRIAQLQTGNPEPLQLLGVIPGATAKERELHAKFAAERIAGEWFTATPALLAQVTELIADAARLNETSS